MKLPTRRAASTSLPGVIGTARVDRRTSAVVRRVRPGDVAVIDHADLDRTHAEALLDAGVVAVVNAAPFISGRYPNLGPELLTRSGIVLVDSVGPDGFRAVPDGATVRLHEGAVFARERRLASGAALDSERVAELMEEARGGLSTQLQTFTHNTTEFLRREPELLLHGRGVPELRTRVAGRPTVVVSRGYHFREDLKRLRRFVREQGPVLVGVDDGADALLEVGLRPDVVVVGEQGLAHPGTEGTRGVGDPALRSARDVVLHTDRSGRVAGAERLERMGLRARPLRASGLTEDVALLLADAAGAELVVTVGSHATLDELLDRQRSGLASMFLTRLKLGPSVVDATAVHALYSGRVRTWHLLVVLLAGVVALVVAVVSTPVGAAWWDQAGRALLDVVDQTQGPLS